MRRAAACGSSRQAAAPISTTPCGIWESPDRKPSDVSKRRTKTRHAKKRLPEENAVDGILSGADVARSKPAPDCFLEAMRREGCTPRETLIFEDSEIGLEAARRSGASYFRGETLSRLSPVCRLSGNRRTCTYRRPRTGGTAPRGRTFRPAARAAAPRNVRGKAYSVPPDAQLLVVQLRRIVGAVHAADVVERGFGVAAPRMVQDHRIEQCLQDIRQPLFAGSGEKGSPRRRTPDAAPPVL